MAQLHPKRKFRAHDCFLPRFCCRGLLIDMRWALPFCQMSKHACCPGHSEEGDPSEAYRRASGGLRAASSMEKTPPQTRLLETGESLTVSGLGSLVRVPPPVDALLSLLPRHDPVEVRRHPHRYLVREDDRRCCC